LRSPARNSFEDALLSPQRQYVAEEEEEAENEPPLEYDSDEDELASAPRQKAPRRATSKLPVSRTADEPPQQQSPLTMATIAAKLAASEREADAARVRAKLQAFWGARRPAPAEPQATQKPASEIQQEAEVEDVDPIKRDPVGEPQQHQQQQTSKPEKRKRDNRTNRVASRRRSTLSPWELDSLISGNVQ